MLWYQLTDRLTDSMVTHCVVTLTTRPPVHSCSSWRPNKVTDWKPAELQNQTVWGELEPLTFTWSHSPGRWALWSCSCWSGGRGWPPASSPGCPDAPSYHEPAGSDRWVHTKPPVLYLESEKLLWAWLVWWINTVHIYSIYCSIHSIYVPCIQYRVHIYICDLLHGDGQFAALVQQLADGVGRVTVTLGQFGHVGLDPSDHALHLHLVYLKQPITIILPSEC